MRRRWSPLPIGALCALWAIRREPAAVAVTVGLFAILAILATPPGTHLVESTGYARPISPLLAYLLFRGIATRSPALAAPSVALNASVAVRVFVRPFLT